MPFFLMKAIILAGGKGSRFAPITDKIPKALIPVNGKTLLERVICSLPDSIDTIIVTTKYLGNLIEKSIGNEFLDKKVIYTKQDELSEGTWPALFSTRNLVRKDEFFCVLNTDDIFDKNEIDKILQKKEVGMGITKKILPAKYHGVRFDNNNFFIKFERHENENREFLVEDFFANGFLIHNSGYRGNIIGAVKNLSNSDYTVEKGTRLFQIVQKSYNPFLFLLVDNLTETSRGAGGFGSTGK